MSYLSEAQRAQLFEMRSAMDKFIAQAAEDAGQINGHMAAIRPWKEGAYAIGDVRLYGGVPYRCVQAHDSTGNPTWTPDAAAALWMQYHGTSAESARAWVSPAGAHDMYKAGEYVIWTDGTVKKCLTDTAYSPETYPQAWEEA